MGSYPVLQFITFKLNNQTKIAYRRQNAVYILNNLGQLEEPIVLDSAIYPYDPYWPYGSLVATNINGRAALIVGVVIERDRILYTDIYGVSLNTTLSTQNTWPMDKCDQEGTSCLDFRRKQPLPQEIEIPQNYPNPFDHTTVIPVDVAKSDQAELRIYNILGQLVKKFSSLGPGKHDIRWNGKNDNSQEVASGIYFYCLSTNKATQTKKMVLIR